MSETSTIKLYTAPPLAYFITCAPGGSARLRATEPFTKAVIRVVSAVVSSLRACSDCFPFWQIVS